MDKEKRLFHLEGVITTTDNADEDFVLDEFIKFVEDHGWFFGGGIQEVEE